MISHYFLQVLNKFQSIIIAFSFPWIFSSSYATSTLQQMDGLLNEEETNESLGRMAEIRSTSLMVENRALREQLASSSGI